MTLGNRSFVIVLLGAVGVSYGLGRVTSQSSPPPTDRGAHAGLERAPAAAPSATRITPAVRDPLPLDALRGELRAAVRDELALLRDENAVTAGDQPASDEPTLSPEQLDERAMQASALLDGAFAAGRMPGTDYAAFHGLLAHLPRAEQEPLLERLIVAINTQELQVDP